MTYSLSRLDRWRWRAVILIRKAHSLLTILEDIIRPSSLLDYKMPRTAILESQSVREIAQKVWHVAPPSLRC